MVLLHTICKCYMYSTIDLRKLRQLGCIETSEAHPRKKGYFTFACIYVAYFQDLEESSFPAVQGLTVLRPGYEDNTTRRPVFSP
jgi:hypothetical protein